jgi:hypothetical protein
LIAHFDKSVEVRVADDVNAIPIAAIFYRHPANIVISRYTLGQTDNPKFEMKYLLAIVAHELGHIEIDGMSTWLMGLCASGIVGGLSFLMLMLVKFNWIGILCSLVFRLICIRARHSFSI